MLLELSRRVLLAGRNATPEIHNPLLKRDGRRLELFEVSIKKSCIWSWIDAE
jgi:hypothetical protein